MEYTAGVGPELLGKEIRERPLDGGYVMVMARMGTESGHLLRLQAQFNY